MFMLSVMFAYRMSFVYTHMCGQIQWSLLIYCIDLLLNNIKKELACLFIQERLIVTIMLMCTVKNNRVLVI